MKGKAVSQTKPSVFPPDEGYGYFDATPAQIAARVSAITLAANVVMTGDELGDKRLAGDICFELLETAAWLSRKLANYHDGLEQSLTA